MLSKFIQKHSFGIMMSTLMSAIMLSINVFIMEGFTLNAFRTIGIMYIPILLIAFIMSTYIVVPAVKPIMKRIANSSFTKTTKTVLNSLLMVTLMSLSMSFIVTLINGPHKEGHFDTWLSSWSRNYPIAFFVQLLAVGPFVRFTHRTLLAPPALQEAISTTRNS